MTDNRAAQARRTRDAILSATIEVALDRGFGPLRIADVAEAADVSVGLVHYHFRSKELLVAAALRRAAEEDLAATDAATAEAATPVQRLERFLASYAPEPGRVGWRLWIDAWGHGLRSPEMASITGELEEAWRARLAAIIAEGDRTGALACADPEAAAGRILAAAAGLAVQTTVHGLRSPGDALEVLLDVASAEVRIDDAP